MTEAEIWDKIIEYGIASEETLQVVTSINGYSVETLNDIIYAQTGYRDMKQLEHEDWLEEEEEE